jgi:hypothetical protein
MDDMNENSRSLDGFQAERTLESGLTRIFDYIPQILTALLLLLLGYLIAKLLAGAVRKSLQRLRFDKAMNASPAGSYVSRLVESPARFTGKLTFWIIFLAFVTFAVSALNLPLLNRIVEGIYAYLPNVVAAVVIFLVASAISAGAAGFATRVMGRTPTAKLVAAVVPALTMSIAVFMILNQLRIAPEIVLITYTAIIGAVALGLALAFGLGGRVVAGRILEQAYEAGRRNAETVKRDARFAKENARDNAKREADRARSKLDE